MDIKELFLSDLDLSDVDGWSDDYIAKINYNFTVIKNGRKKGPQGLQGPVGLDGSQGGQGPEGATGIVGIAGNQGPDGTTTWNRIGGDYDNFDNDTLIPLSNVSQPNSIFPTASIILGRVISPTVPGPIDINGTLYSPEDNINNTYISQSNSVPEISDNPDDGIKVPILKINTTNDTNDNIRKHIRLVDYNDNTKFGEIYFDYNDTSTTIKSTGSLNLTSNHITIALGGIDKISISNNFIYIDFVSTFFNDNVEFDSNSSLQFNSSAVQENNVIKSIDGVGNSVWGNITNTDIAAVGGGLPIGSIIKIPLDTFTSSFITSYSGNGSDTQYGLVESELGKGLGDYSGWYVCNGVTWEANGRDRIYSPNNNWWFWSENITTPVFNDIPDLMGTFNNGGLTLSGSNIPKILGCGNLRIYSQAWSNVKLDTSLDYPETEYIIGVLHGVPETEIGQQVLTNEFNIESDYVHIVYLDNPGLYQFLSIEN